MFARTRRKANNSWCGQTPVVNSCSNNKSSESRLSDVIFLLNVSRPCFRCRNCCIQNANHNNSRQQYRMPLLFCLIRVSHTSAEWFEWLACRSHPTIENLLAQKRIQYTNALSLAQVHSKSYMYAHNYCTTLDSAVFCRTQLISFLPSEPTCVHFRVRASANPKIQL